MAKKSLVPCEECGALCDRHERVKRPLCNECMGVLECPLCGGILVSVGRDGGLAYWTEDDREKCSECGWQYQPKEASDAPISTRCEASED